MEYEKINEDTIRVLIKHDDLKAHGLSLIDFLRNRQHIERFFHQILEEIDLREDFEQSDAVTFQIVPNLDGLELYISKGEDAQEDLLNTLADDYQNQYEEVPEHEENSEGQADAGQSDVGEFAVQFHSFEDVISLSKSLYLEGGDSTLYEWSDHYYLLLQFSSSQTMFTSPTEQYALALEYGSQASHTISVIKEHGRQLIASHALEEIRYSFE